MEEHGLRMFEIRLLRKILEPKRQKVARSWRKLHNEELHDLYSLPHVRKLKNKVKTMLICSLYSDFDIYMAHV